MSRRTSLSFCLVLTLVVAAAQFGCEGSVPGACCLADGSCIIDLEIVCTTTGGTYQGDNTTCDPDPCGGGDGAVPGACCLEDGSCIIDLEEVCTTTGGTYQGDNTTCDPDPCGGG